MKIVGSQVILTVEKNVFIKHGQRRSIRLKPLPQMYIKVCTTDANPPNDPLVWDTDGISFIIDNTTTAIRSTVRKVFTRPLQPTRVAMKTADDISTHTKVVGSPHLVPTNDNNWNHIYTISGCGYNPVSLMNILGVPTLGKFFKDSANPNNELWEDGTTVNSEATKSHLIWDHGKHEKHILFVAREICQNCVCMSGMDISMPFVLACTDFCLIFSRPQQLNAQQNPT